MGNFYVNYTVPGVDAGAVAAALAGRTAMVVGPVDGCTIILDQQSDEQDQAVVQALGSSISAALNSPTLAVLNHDDDVLMYFLFERGEVVDSYNSTPGYFTDAEDDPLPEGGDAHKLCTAFGGSDPDEVERVLRATSDDYLFAVKRHEALFRALHLPQIAVGLGFEYASKGDLPNGVDPSSVLRLG